MLFLASATLAWLAADQDVAQPDLTVDPGVGVIRSARIVDGLRPVDRFGDLWATTWAADDSLFLAWGDGTGRGDCYPAAIEPVSGELVTTFGQDYPIYHAFRFLFAKTFPALKPEALPLCMATQAGLLNVATPVSQIAGGGEEHIVTRHIPTGHSQFQQGIDPDSMRSDKPSSLLFLDGTLYFAGHTPLVTPDKGYLAYSDDKGMTWTEVPGTPWTDKSNYRVLMFINMGRDYTLNADGYVYALGIGNEWVHPTQSQPVYLARVLKDRIRDYSYYEYFSGQAREVGPVWSAQQSDAAPLTGIGTVGTGAAMFHEGIGRYLFLGLPGHGSGPTFTLFEAPQPWGPWTQAQTFPGQVYIPGIIAKDAGPRSFYFTAAGGSATYQLNIGQIELELREDAGAVDASALPPRQPVTGGAS